MQKVFFAAALCVLGGSAANGAELVARARPTPGQEEMFVSGVQSVKSIGKHGRIALELWPSSTDEFVRAFVYTRNDGAAPVNVGVENISVRAGDKVLRVLAPEEMRKRINKKAGRAKFFNAVVAGLGAAAADYNATSYGTFRSPYGTSTFRVTNPYLAAAGRDAAFAQAGARQHNIEAAAADAKASTSEMLQMTTVMPGEKYGGPIFIEKPAFTKKGPTPLNLTVNFAGEQHDFHVEVQRH